MKETYPAPRGKPVLVSSNPDPDFSGDRRQYEDRVFRRADHFNIVRFTSHSGSQTCTVKTFAEAVYVAHKEPRALIYAVDSRTGDAFCIVREDWSHYAEVWLSLHPRKEGAS